VDDIRALNATIASAYDAVAYDPNTLRDLDVDRLSGVAALFGSKRVVKDVLDLGCGAGGQLAVAASQAKGRLVGVDLSGSSCAKARERLAEFGDRVDIRNADLLDLDPADLGQFDLVYLNGVYYVAPLAVQARLLEVIGRVLRPGGLAVISYYAGAVAELRALLYRTLADVAKSADSPQAALEAAKAHAGRLRDAIRDPVFGPPMRALIDGLADYPESVLYLEALGGAFSACRTSDLQARLGAHGVQFITYLDAPAVTRADTARARALDADIEDLSGGGYHFGVFMRRGHDGIATDVRATAVAWSSGLARSQPLAGGGAVFVDAVRDLNFTIRSPLTAAFLEAAIAGAVSWREGLEAARVQSPPGPDPAAEEAVLAADLDQLWRLGAVMPKRA
jgi:SAM-dependent methyltransferase